MSQGSLIPHVTTPIVMYSVHAGEFVSWLTFTWGLSSSWKFVLVKYKLVPKLQALVITNRK